MKAIEIRTKSKEELLAELKKMQEDLKARKDSLLTGKDKKVSDIRNLKKDIARIQTVLREKEIIEG